MNNGLNKTPKDLKEVAIGYGKGMKKIHSHLIKNSVIALMEAASFCAGVRHKRYSVQQEQLLIKNEITSI